MNTQESPILVLTDDVFVVRVQKLVSEEHPSARALQRHHEDPMYIHERSHAVDLDWQ
jgi:hypothetical protein